MARDYDDIDGNFKLNQLYDSLFDHGRLGATRYRHDDTSRFQEMNDGDTLEDLAPLHTNLPSGPIPAGRNRSERRKIEKRAAAEAKQQAKRERSAAAARGRGVYRTQTKVRAGLKEEKASEPAITHQSRAGGSRIVGTPLQHGEGRALLLALLASEEDESPGSRSPARDAIPRSALIEEIDDDLPPALVSHIRDSKRLRRGSLSSGEVSETDGSARSPHPRQLGDKVSGFLEEEGSEVDACFPHPSDGSRVFQPGRNIHHSEAYSSDGADFQVPDDQVPSSDFTFTSPLKIHELAMKKGRVRSGYIREMDSDDEHLSVDSGSSDQWSHYGDNDEMLANVSFSTTAPADSSKSNITAMPARGDSGQRHSLVGQPLAPLEGAAPSPGAPMQAHSKIVGTSDVEQPLVHDSVDSNTNEAVGVSKAKSKRKAKKRNKKNKKRQAALREQPQQDAIAPAAS